MSRLNVPILLFSIALATSAWFIVYGQSLTRSLPVSVQLSEANVSGLPRRLFIDQINNKRAIVLHLVGPTGQVTIVGTDPDLAKHISIDLSNATVGDQAYPLIFDASVAKVIPETVKIPVKIEEIVSKTVPVKVEVRGKLHDPTSSLTSTPTSETSVVVTAPKSIADMITAAKAVLQVSQINPNNPPESIDTSLLPVDETGRVYNSHIVLQPDHVGVSPIIGAAQVNKTVIISANIVGNPAPGYIGKSYKVIPPVLQLTGPSSMLVNTSSVSTEKIDVTGLSASKLFTVRIINPRGASVQTNVARVQVIIEKDNTLKPSSTTKQPTKISANSTTSNPPPGGLTP